MSDLEFRPIHNFFRVTISSIKHMKDSNSDTISLHICNNSPYKITLPLQLLGYCEISATISPTNKIAYRVNNIFQLLNICQSTILDEEVSINNILSNEKRNQINSQTHSILNLISNFKIHGRTIKISNNV